MNIDRLQWLEDDEGYRGKMYFCTEGKPTIGIGVNLEQQELPHDLAVEWLNRIVSATEDEMLNHEVLAWLKRELTHNRWEALVNMAYQLGVPRLLRFKKMLAGLHEKDWQKAHDEALDSRWAKQTPNRANRVADVLLCG